MEGERSTATVEELLAEAGWLRRLAVRLAGDADVADDVVQETFIAAMRRAPERGESVRPWLATVLRNALRMRARGEGRRAAREQAVPASDEVPTPEVLVAKAEAQRLLAGLVLRLDEPYRGTVLLHFGEGMSLAEIARTQGIAAGTARWRLKVALDQLREWLDVEAGGRGRWMVAPLFALPKGALVAQKSSNVFIAIALLLALVVGGVFLMRSSGEAGDGAMAGADQRSSEGWALNPSLAGAPDGLMVMPVWLGQPGVEARPIAGQVTYQGTPVEGATVELASLASESGAVMAPRRTTGADGAFDFGLQPALEWSVRATAPGRTGAAITVDLRNPVSRPPPDRLEIELGPCDAAMFGRVRDASGGGIAGARLARLATGGGTNVPGGVAVETDATGAYELCVERTWPGLLRVGVSADGYGAIVFRGMVLGRVKVDFALVPEATIVGRVVRDDSGEPVGGAHVYLPPGPLGVESTSWRGTFTGDDGHFRLDQVAPGRHRVLARADGMVGSPQGTPVLVEAGQTTNEIEIRMEAGSVLRGVVRQAGEPVAGARVAAIATDGVRSARTSVSQEDGSFVLEEVPRGAVRFTAWPYDVVSPERFTVDRARHEGLVLEVEALGTIVGQVLRDRQPVAGAGVKIHGPNAGELDAIRTDAGGRFEARGLRPGPWVLFGEDEREGRFGRATPQTVQLAAGETEEVEIELTYGAAIAGTVVDQDGAPVAGVSVEFWHTGQDDAGIAVTSTDGSFRAATMTGGGRYRTIVRPYQGSNATLPPAPGTELPIVELAGGDSEVTGVVIAVQLDDLSIAGRVIDSSGAPVPDARVAATPIRDGAPPRFFRWVHYAATTTDVDGRFAIDELSAGSHALQARSPAGAETTVEGIRAGATGVVLTLPTPGAIEGTVVGFADRPEVSALPADVSGHPAPTGADVAGDSFAIRGLSPGSYLVTARNATEGASVRVEVGAGTTSRVTLTNPGSGTVVGRVREFRTGEPVEGMTCVAQPRVGTDASYGHTGDSARSDAQGTFVLTAPAGDLVIGCAGLDRVYSDGLRLVTLSPSRRLELEVPVVALREDVALTLAGFGAELETGALQPYLVQVDPEGPAAAAGLRDGDRVVAVDGAPVTELSPRGVRMLIQNNPPATTVEITVDRGGRTVTGEVILVEHDLTW